MQSLGFVSILVLAVFLNTSCGRAPSQQARVEQALAAECSFVRLDETQADGSEGSMRNVQVRDQGPFGICYAEAAAQMVDAYRFGVLGDQSFGRQTAAMSAAIGLDEAIGANPYAGGHSCQVVSSIQTVGAFDSFSVTRCILKSETTEVVGKLSGIYDETRSLLKSAPPLSESAKVSVLTAQSQKASSSLRELNFPEDRLPPPSVISYLLGLSKLRFIWGVEAYQCFNQSPSTKLNLPSCKTIGNRMSSEAFFSREIDQRLNRPRPQPIEISYCDGVLLGGRSYAGVRRTPPWNVPACTQLGDGRVQTGPHASLVIGRRKNPSTGQCQYLVRNSWSRNCDYKNPPITLPPDLRAKWTIAHPLTKKIPIYAPEWECENGNIWVDEDTLLKSVYSISYLDN